MTLSRNDFRATERTSIGLLDGVDDIDVFDVV